MDTRGNVVFVWVTLSWMIFVSSTAVADWVHLKNGRKIQGEVTKRDGKYHIDQPRGSMVIDEERVDHIEREQKRDYRFDQAVRMRDRHLFDEAIRRLKQLQTKQQYQKKAREALQTTYVKAIRWHFEKQELPRSQSYLDRATKQFPDENVFSEWRQKVEQYRQQVNQLVQEARAALRKRNYQQALSRYEQAVEKLPGKLQQVADDLASAYFGRGKQLYRKQNFRSARTHFLKALEYNPREMGQAEPYFVHATLKAVDRMLGKRQFSEAERLLRTSLAVSADSLRLRFFLGEFYRKTGDEQLSRRAYGRIIERPIRSRSMDFDKLRQKAAKISRVQLSQPSTGGRTFKKVLSGDWRTSRTAHFKIYHRNHDLARRARAVAEDYYDRLRSTFRIREEDWDTPCKIYLYPSRSSYQNQVEGMPASSGVTQVRTRFGRLKSHRILTYQQAKQLFRSVLPHELAHVMWKRAVGYRDIPRWLSEGVAVRFEASYYQKFYRWKVATNLRNQGAPSLRTLLKRSNYPRSENQKQLMYARAFSLVDLLLERRGWQTLLQLARNWRSTEPEELLQKYYRLDSLGELEQQWITHIRDSSR